MGLLAGESADLDRIEPVLAAFCGRQIRCGPRGHGAVVKLAVNALFAARVAALDEVLSLGREGGLEPGALLDCLASLPVSSPAVVGVGRGMLAGPHTPGFPITLVEKDVRYAVQAGGGAVLEAVRGRFAAARDAGRGALHLSALYGS